MSPPHHTPTIFCSQCGTPAQVCPCGETHRLYAVEVCGRCTATGGMPVPIVTRSRWSCLALVTLVSGVFIAGAMLALRLHQAVGLSLWLTLPVMLGLGLALGWYGSATSDVPIEEP
jgi:hypothetical protein